MEENKPKAWSFDQEIQYEIALDTINSLEGLLERQANVMDDEQKISSYEQRALELFKETRFFGGFDDEIVKDVIQTYAPLVREYYDMVGTEEEIAAKGLPETFLTTKVDYAKYGK